MFCTLERSAHFNCHVRSADHAGFLQLPTRLVQAAYNSPFLALRNIDDDDSSCRRFFKDLDEFGSRGCIACPVRRENYRQKLSGQQID